MSRWYRRMRLFKILLLFACVGLFLSSCSSDQKNSPASVTPSQAAQGPAYLGILYIESLDGVVISEVYPDSPAEKAGLRPYDLIVSANGFPVIGPFTLKDRILSLQPGTQVEIEVIRRDGGHALKRVVLEPMPERFRHQGERF